MKTTPHLFSRTYSGEGHTDTLFKLFGSKEDAIVAMNMQITADGWTPDEEHEEQTETNKAYISDDECTIPRYQVIKATDWPYLIISYYQPNEVSIHEGRNTYEGAIKSLAEWKESEVWDEEPEVDFDEQEDVNAVYGDIDSVFNRFEIIKNPFCKREFTDVYQNNCECGNTDKITYYNGVCPGCLSSK